MQKKHLKKFNIHLWQTVNIACRKGTYLNMIKAICKPKYTASIIVSGEKLNLFLYGQEKDKDIPPCHFYST